MSKNKSNFNIHECEGKRDGMTGEGIHLSIRFTMLKNMREIFSRAPIMAVYEDNYNTYKQAFLNAYWSVKGLRKT